MRTVAGDMFTTSQASTPQCMILEQDANQISGDEQKPAQSIVSWVRMQRNTANTSVVSVFEETPEVAASCDLVCGDSGSGLALALFSTLAAAEPWGWLENLNLWNSSRQR